MSQVRWTLRTPGTKTVPSPITGNVLVELWGAGASGRGSAVNGGGGGGGGAYAATSLALTQNARYGLVLPAGGASPTFDGPDAQFGSGLVGAVVVSRATTQLASAGGSVNYGASATAGNGLFLWVGAASSTATAPTVATPTGWIRVNGGNASNATLGKACAGILFYRTSQGGDASPSITLTGAVGGVAVMTEIAGQLAGATATSTTPGDGSAVNGAAPAAGSSSQAVTATFGSATTQVDVILAGVVTVSTSQPSFTWGGSQVVDTSATTYTNTCSASTSLRATTPSGTTPAPSVTATGSAASIQCVLLTAHAVKLNVTASDVAAKGGVSGTAGTATAQGSGGAGGSAASSTGTTKFSGGAGGGGGGITVAAGGGGGGAGSAGNGGAGTNNQTGGVGGTPDGGAGGTGTATPPSQPGGGGFGGSGVIQPASGAAGQARLAWSMSDASGVGTGTCTYRVRVTRAATGVGTGQKALLVVRDLRTATGVGTASRKARARATETATGVGTASKFRARPRVTKTMVGIGTPTKRARTRATRTATGVGTVSYSRLLFLLRAAQASGIGMTTFARVIVFVRYAQATGVGTPKGRIALDMDDLPDASTGGTTNVYHPLFIFDD